MSFNLLVINPCLNICGGNFEFLYIIVGFSLYVRLVSEFYPPWQVHPDLPPVQTDLALLLAVGVFQLCKDDLSRS